MTEDKNYFEIYTEDDLKTFWLSFMTLYDEESKEFREKAKEILYDMIDVVFNIRSEENIKIAKEKAKSDPFIRVGREHYYISFRNIIKKLDNIRRKIDNLYDLEKFCDYSVYHPEELEYAICHKDTTKEVLMVRYLFHQFEKYIYGRYYRDIGRW